MKHAALPAVVLSAAFVLWAVAREGDDDGAALPRGSYLRFVQDGEMAGRLETANVTCRNSAGVEVTLFSAVHVADAAYYRALEGRFRGCDALLYEMVKDPDTPPPRPGVGGGSDNLLSFFQRSLKSALGLEFQLDAVDYGRPNFVHADLDPVTFFRLQADRGESIAGLVLRAAMEAWKLEAAGKGSTISVFDLVRAFTSRDRARSLKFLLAGEIEKVEDLLAGIEKGKDGKGSVILTERNKKVIEVLRREIGRGRRKIGIFYGAAHMADMEARLRRDLGLERVAEEWVTAWDIRGAAASPGPWPLWRARTPRFQLVLPDRDRAGARLAATTIARHLRDLFGVGAPAPADGSEPGTFLVFGDAATSSCIERLVGAGLAFSGEDLGDEGFEIRTHEDAGRRYVVLHGRTPRALKHAAQELLFYRVLAVADDGDLEAPLAIVRRPEVTYRGVYMLPCWAAKDSFASWRRVLLFNSELTLNRNWFWLDGFPLAGHTGEYAGTPLADPAVVQSLIDLAGIEEMKFLIGGGWFNWHHEKAVGKDLEKGREYYLEYLSAFTGFHGFYIEPTGEGSETASWRTEGEALSHLVRDVLERRPDFEIAIAVGKFNSPEYLKLLAALDPRRVFWWWCWGDPRAGEALKLYPSVLRWHLSTPMSEYHGSIQPPGVRDLILSGVATSYDPGQGFGNPWNGWGKLGADAPRDFHPHTVPYFAQQYHYRERCWDTELKDDAFAARLQRRLFDRGAPADAAKLYLALSRLAQASASQPPLAESLEPIEALTAALRAMPATPRMADTVARMDEALAALRKLVVAK